MNRTNSGIAFIFTRSNFANLSILPRCTHESAIFWEYSRSWNHPTGTVKTPHGSTFLKYRILRIYQNYTSIPQPPTIILLLQLTPPYSFSKVIPVINRDCSRIPNEEVEPVSIFL